MKALRVLVTEEEYVKLKQHVSHHGEISFILRKAVNEFLKQRLETAKDVKRKK
jgi:hypothetical protein